MNTVCRKLIILYLTPMKYILGAYDYTLSVVKYGMNQPQKGLLLHTTIIGLTKYIH